MYIVSQMHKRGFLVGGRDVRVHLTYPNLPGIPAFAVRSRDEKPGEAWGRGYVLPVTYLVP